MIWRWLSIALLAGVAAGAAVPEAKARFDGFRVYRVVPSTQEQVQFLQDMENKNNNFNFWSRPALNSSVDVMVSPYLRIDFRDLARSVGLDAKIFIEDVQKLIDVENPQTRTGKYDWTAYYRIAEVNEWLNSLESTYPDRVEVINIGKSYEGRDILGVKISSNKEGAKTVFVESGIHAREWITVATATYLINELLTSDNTDIRNIADNFNWYIIPSTNPDGYEYSHTTYRLWRKTRSPGKDTACYGADPNRNWDVEWDDDRGSSSNECSETYRGHSVFSEPETANLRDYLIALEDDLLVYFCIHSYSQVLMIPYGLPDIHAEYASLLKTIGLRAVEVLKNRHGTTYGFGEIYEAIKYMATGGSMDWVEQDLKVKYTFEWELRDTGRFGFLLPASQIIDTADETIDSMVYILQEVQKEEEKEEEEEETKEDGSDEINFVEHSSS